MGVQEFLAAIFIYKNKCENCFFSILQVILLQNACDFSKGTIHEVQNKLGIPRKMMELVHVDLGSCSSNSMLILNLESDLSMSPSEHAEVAVMSLTSICRSPEVFSDDRLINLWASTAILLYHSFRAASSPG